MPNRAERRKALRDAYRKVHAQPTDTEKPASLSNPAAPSPEETPVPTKEVALSTPVDAIQQQSIPPPIGHRFDTNFIWAPVAIGIGLVGAVIGAMMKDIRWLLLVAWPFLTFGLWWGTRLFIGRGRWRWIALGIEALLIFYGLRSLAKSLEPKIPSPVPLMAFYIGCEFDHIPLTIRPGSLANIMWLEPSLLRGNPTMPFVGPFEIIRAPWGRKELLWPSEKRDGRWMTRQEMNAASKASKGIPNPYAFRCTLSNYAVTVDEVTATLIIDTSDNRRHTYDIPFSPSVLGHPFEFYMVNKCTVGVVPTLVQWGDSAIVRVLGESGRRRVPLQFERRSWPSNLAIMGPSWFIWNDTKAGCKWE